MEVWWGEQNKRNEDKGAEPNLAGASVANKSHIVPLASERLQTSDKNVQHQLRCNPRRSKSSRENVRRAVQNAVRRRLLEPCFSVATVQMAQ
jgi:hypothetical protein